MGEVMRDDDIVEMSIGELIDALADALSIVGRKPRFRKGDRIKLTGTVTGVINDQVNIVVEGLPQGRRSIHVPTTALQLDEVA
jgi:hypothetical protein